MQMAISKVIGVAHADFIQRASPKPGGLLKCMCMYIFVEGQPGAIEASTFISGGR